MQKFSFLLLVTVIIIFSACRSRSNASLNGDDSTNATNIFPVTSFLKGQLRMLDSMPVTPLRTISENGKTDSTWLKREDIRKNAAPFLTPVIDSASMKQFFTEKSFLDQTIDAFTFSFDPKAKLPDSIHLTHWDVYMSPATNDITRIYLVKENGDTTTQLTWVVNKSYIIRKIIQKPGKEPEIKEEKMIWDFDE